MIIPPSIIGAAAPVVSDAYTHAQLNSLFYAAGFGGDPPEGNKLNKCQEWLREANRRSPERALELFGRLIAEFMDTEPNSYAWQSGTGPDPRVTISNALAREGLSYQRGGYILGAALTGPSKSLGERLRGEGVTALETEYMRAYAQLEADPPAALTAACAILETLCKTYLEAEGHPLPNKQVLSSLWSETAAHLGLSPKDFADTDMKQILSGLFSIATGVAALRTHRGSAHGHTDPVVGATYALKPRQARLAVHAAHTMALFALESWEAQRRAKGGQAS